MSDLIKYEAAKHALAEAKSVDEVCLIRDKAQAIQAAARIAKDRQMEVDASEIRIRAERRLGEMMAAQRDAGMMQTGGDAAKARVGDGPEVDKPTLAEVGIDKHLADRARKTAAIPQEDFEQTLLEHREQQEAITAKTMETLARQGRPHVSHNSGVSEWYTPRNYIAAARTVMGTIDVDPASNADANAVVEATTYYTADDDGLSHDWSGNVWMNPPYSQPSIQQFCDKLAEHWRDGEINAAIVLVNNATETAWFQRLLQVASGVCFPRGRVKFWNPEKESAPLQGQAVLYIGGTPHSFVDKFMDFGECLHR